MTSIRIRSIPLQHSFLWATPNFCSNICCWLQVHKQPHPLFHVCIFTAITIYSLQRATPVHTLLLQDFQECYPCSMPWNIVLQTTFSRTVFASLQEATPTDQLRYIFLSCIRIARYLQHVINTISECDPRFYLFGLHPGQLSWPGFNAVLHCKQEGNIAQLHLILFWFYNACAIYPKYHSLLHIILIQCQIPNKTLRLYTLSLIY